jgi:hypothetical protein
VVSRVVRCTLVRLARDARFVIITIIIIKSSNMYEGRRHLKSFKLLSESLENHSPHSKIREKRPYNFKVTKIQMKDT